MSSKSISEIGGDTEFDEQRQPLDITKEFFAESEMYTKSILSAHEIVIIARALYFGNRYHVPDVEELVKRLLLLRRSKGGKVLNYFKETLKNMKPTFESKQSEGEMRI